MELTLLRQLNQEVKLDGGEEHARRKQENIQNKTHSKGYIQIINSWDNK